MVKTPQNELRKAKERIEAIAAYASKCQQNTVQKIYLLGYQTLIIIDYEAGAQSLNEIDGKLIVRPIMMLTRTNEHEGKLREGELIYSIAEVIKVALCRQDGMEAIQVITKYGLTVTVSVAIHKHSHPIPKAVLLINHPLPEPVCPTPFDASFLPQNKISLQGYGGPHDNTNKKQ